MKSKKIMAGVLSASVLLLSADALFAATNTLSNHGKEESEIIPIRAEIDQINQTQYHFFTGKVTEINDVYGVEGSKLVTVINEEEQVANMVLSKDTYLLGDSSLEVGTSLTGFYDAHAPMLMIYPPQYKTEVAVVGKIEGNIKVDLFEQNLVSADHSLKLNISEETEIISQSGETFDGDLVNRHLVVIYGVSTRSIPAQTTPTKIIVLNKKQALVEDISSMEIVVDNHKIDGPTAYLDEEGTVMVPLRAVAEQLGYKVTWEAKSQSVRLGHGISVTIGKDYYVYMRTAPIELGTAPTLNNGVTYVPLQFFRDVAKLTNAYVFEGQIVINNFEKME